MEVEEFLEKKGAIPLLCELNAEGVSFSDLEDNLPVATSTFNVRREQALKLDLIKPVGEERGTAGGHVYAFTEKGQRLRDELDDRGIPQTYQRYRFQQEKFESQAQDFRDKISAEEISQ